MHLVLISDHETQGGAAQSASRLAEGLARLHQVTRLVLFPDGQSHPWRSVVLGQPSALRLWVDRFGRRLSPQRFPYPHTPEFLHKELRRHLRRLRPDVVNLHNLHGGSAHGWTPGLAAVAAEFAPIVWTLHDMWSFTGRCAYSYDCQAYVTGCGASCPTHHEHPVLEAQRIAPAWRERQRLVQENPLVAVSPSRWLAQEARRGLWANRRVEVIPYGLDLDVYQPLNRQEARKCLGLPVDGPVVLVAAVDLAERRKGAGFFPALWRSVASRPLTILTMGQGTIPVDDPSIEVRSLGFVIEATRRRLAYAAADVLLHPAPVDNFPNVLLEAFACGTPAVGFRVGGVPELIRPGVSGWLAPEVTAAALGKTLAQALGAIQAGGHLGKSCRMMAEAEFSWERQVQQYTELFAELVDVSRPMIKEESTSLR